MLEIAEKPAAKQVRGRLAQGACVRGPEEQCEKGEVPHPPMEQCEKDEGEGPCSLAEGACVRGPEEER